MLDGSHEWIYDIGNFDKNLKHIPEDKISIINITDTIITYRFDHTQIQIGLIDQGNGEELWVMTKCEYDGEGNPGE